MVKYKTEEEVKFSPQEKVLRYLIENKSPHSIMEASGAIIVDYKNTYNIVEELQPNLISKEKIGNTNLIKLKPRPDYKIYSVENKRTKQFLQKNKELKLVQEDIESLNYPFFIALLFGSTVKGERTKKSDIDLCIISDSPEKSKELMSKLKLLPIPLEIHDFSIKEFESMLKTKESNLGEEIVKNNIILYGIENYYNLISKWMKKE